MSFEFLDPGRLLDGELELVAPEVRWVEPLLRSCAHPQSAEDPGAASMTRGRAMDFLRAAPSGRQPGDPRAGRVPTYHFWMRLRQVTRPELHDRPLPRWGEAPPPVEIAGGLGLRIGNTPDLELYLGHIGYNVFAPARGHHYAERSCRLLLELVRRHGMRRVWITCNPDNWASRRTCERLGCRLADIVTVPPGHVLYQRGDREKCRYWMDVPLA
jgi:RimJ/RimL family protein N-acetyltransferase